MIQKMGSIKKFLFFTSKFFIIIKKKKLLIKGCKNLPRQWKRLCCDFLIKFKLYSLIYLS